MIVRERERERERKRERERENMNKVLLGRRGTAVTPLTPQPLRNICSRCYWVIWYAHPVAKELQILIR